MPQRTNYYAIGVCVFVLACSPEPDLPPVIEASEQLVLAGPDLVCAGTFEAMESRVAMLQTLFAVPPAPVYYYWMPDTFDESPCPTDSMGCTNGTTIYAQVVPFEHELVHAARTDSLPLVLEEGLATLLGEHDGPPASRDELLLMLDGEIDILTPPRYERAAHFMSFMLDRGGFDAIAQVERQTDRSMPPAQWRPIVEAVYGESWDDLWGAYLDYPECDAVTMHEDVLLCHGDEQPIAQLTPGFGEPRSLSVEMDCDAPGTVGPQRDVVITEILVEFAPLESLYVFVELTGDVVPGSSATLSRCGAACAEGDGVRVTAQDRLLTLDVVPGRYVLELRQPVGVGGMLGVETSY